MQPFRLFSYLAARFAPMGLTYYKRYRMEIRLDGQDFRRPPLPREYRFVPWDIDLLESHAGTMFQCFRSELDANVFTCFQDYAGCLRLMEEISRKDGFFPEATWMLEYVGAGRRKREYCGSIQGIRESTGYGAIQNIGISPFHRDRGLGTRLIHQALWGFQQAGLRRAYLEVTAQNRAAVKLYQRMGFRKVRTLYKAVEVAYAGAAD